MSKARNKKPAAKVGKNVAKPVQAEPVAEVTAKPVVTTVQPVVNSPREKQNGVTKPRSGKCGDVWGVCNELITAGKPVSFEAIRAELPASIADATIKTQRQRHRTFHGLVRKSA